MWRWLLVLLIALHPAVAAAAARGASIVLLIPPNLSPELGETLTRVHGELVADGLEVTERPFEMAPQPAELLRVAATEPAAIAVVGLFLRDEGSGLELWVVDQLTGKSLVTRVEVKGSETDSAATPSPEVLSRRAVEVLRATLLEPWFRRQQAARPGPVEPPTATPKTPQGPPRESPWRVGAGVGGGVLWNAAELEPALLPALNLRLAFAERFFTRLSAAGLGTRPRIERPEGSAAVAQDLFLVDVGTWLIHSGLARPSLGLGLGAWRVEAEARATEPYRATRDEQWALAMKASAGIALFWEQRWALELELEGLLSAPYSQVRFDGVEVARFGRPSLFGKLMLVGWL